MHTPHPNDFRRAILALLGVQLLFGLHYSVAREVTSVIPPTVWTLFRVGGAAVIMTVLYLALKGLPRWKAKDWWLLVVLGFFGIGLNQLLFNEGISRSTSIHAVLVMATIPMQTLVFGVVAGQERFNRRKVMSLMLGILGVLLLTFQDLVSHQGSLLTDRSGNPVASFWQTMMAGDLMMLLNSASFSAFLVMSRKVAGRFTSLELTAGCYLGSILPVVAYVLVAPTLSGVQGVTQVDYASVPTSVWLLGAFVILGPTIATYFLNFYAVKRVPASVVGFLVYLQFIVASITGYFWHDERFDQWTVAAAVLVLGSIAIRFVPKRRATVETSVGSLESVPNVEAEAP